MTGQRLPSGTVTFLLTDVEDSTRLWEEASDAMDRALARHDEIIVEAVERHGGTVNGPRGEGDSHFTIFPRASHAVAAALDAQLALHGEVWPTLSPLRVRMAMHTGEADLRRGDYYGTDVNRCARLRAIARGGQTVVSGTTTSLVASALPDSATLRDLGAHSLRGLRGTERVYQLCHPKLPEDFPPLNSGHVADNLPIELTSFVGRTREVAEVCDLLDASRVVTLTGPGGSGKTRLALRVAEEVSDRFHDGAWLVELASIDDQELVPQAVATALRIVEEAGFQIEATLAARLHDKDLLLVVDNCEHLVDAVASLANEVLRSGPGLRLLATSREPLGIAGEAIWDVPPLAFATDDGTSASSVMRHDAARLFCERARFADASFMLTDANAEAVLRICRRMDGLPLGIELCAATTRVLPVEAIADRLEQRLPLPTVTDRTREPRHRTIESAIAWSYDLLSEDEQRLLRRLAVFVGGFSLEAVHAVCADEDDDTLQPLSGLVEKSLLVKTIGVGGRVRYRLLETVLAFAAERLAESPDERDTRDRHLEYCVSLAVDWSGYFTDPVTFLDRFEEEHDNLRAALAWSLATDVAAGLRLAAGIGGFWNVRGHWTEGAAWLRTLLAEQAVQSPTRVEALNYLASLIMRRDEGDEAIVCLEEAVATARRIDSVRWIAFALSQVAFSAGLSHRFDLAHEALEEAVPIAETCGDEIARGQVLHSRAAVLTMEGRPEALEATEEVLIIWRRIGARGEASFILYFLARAALEARDHARARIAIEESLQISRDLQDRGHNAICLYVFAAIAASEGELERALRLAGASAALLESVGSLFSRHADVQRFEESWIEPARRALGSRATSLWSQGRAMPVDVAVEYALGRIEAPRTVASSRQALTRRELEVARHLTTGRTNRQIAEELVISERTADAHVEHIRNKLGLRTRAQIAAWVTEQDLGRD